jgi:GWxTD domain-containing protein
MRQGRVESPAYLAGPAAAIFTLLLAVWIPVRIGSAASADLLPADELTPDPLAWLETVDSLITPSEATVYRTLQHDYRRQAFIDRFRSERDPFPETSRNEFLEAWQERLQLAQERFPERRDDRAETLLLTGPPHQILTGPCPQQLEPMEIWLFNASPQLPEPITLVFLQESAAAGASLNHWSPTNGLDSLISRPVESQPEKRSGRPSWVRQCRSGGEVFAALAIAAEWADEFLARSTDLPPGTNLLPSTLEIDYPGRHQFQTVVQGLISIPLAEATPGKVGDEEAYRFQVDGEVIRDDRLLESFRYRFELLR